MERIIWVVKRFLIPPAILLLFIAGMTLTGCAVLETQRITITDPSHLRVGVFFNSMPTNYRLKFEGAITGWKESNDSFSFHAQCTGRFEGVIHAYKVIGVDESGHDVLFYIGEQRYSFRTDGRNIMRNEESYDDVVTIYSYFHKYPNVLGEKTHYPVYTGPCGLMDIKFRWGK